MYIDCTPPDFVEGESVLVSFDIILKTDNTGAGNDITGIGIPLIITSSNLLSEARLVSDSAAIYSGSDLAGWEILSAYVPSPSHDLPAQLVLGMVRLYGNGLFFGTYILAHVIVASRDTTTICIDTQHTETVELGLCVSLISYTPVWYSACCSVTTPVCSEKSGDANGDSQVSLTDIIFIASYFFNKKPVPIPLCRGDFNGDGRVNFTDIFYGINYIFKGGVPPKKSWVCCL